MVIKILHIAKDDKFFDSTYKTFESDNRIQNRAVLIVKSLQYNFKYIKKTECVKLLCGKENIRKELLSEYDVIYFHSLKPSHYSLFNYIPKEKIVIWWCWGYELYLPDKGMPPLIPLHLYKPQTKEYINCQRSNTPIIKELVKKTITGRLWACRRRKIIRRINYFQPVLPIEYKLMKKNNRFNAKEFYSNGNLESYISDLSENEGVGNILIGHSASYSNNHLDVWNSIKDFVPTEAEVIFPINYGYEKYAEYIYNSIPQQNKKIRFIKSFLPKEEYYSVLDSCSYAIFGVIRQEAIGNIYYCLQRGIKVFLYQDSMVYDFLKEAGFIVFSIEEINKNSFMTPLTKEQTNQNRKSLKSDAEYRNEIYERFIEDLTNRVNR